MANCSYSIFVNKFFLLYIDSLYFHYAFQNFPFFCHSLYNRKILHKTLIEFYTDFKKCIKYQKHYYKSVTYLKFQPHFSNFPISYFHDKSAEYDTSPVHKSNHVHKAFVNTFERIVTYLSTPDFINPNLPSAEKALFRSSDVRKKPQDFVTVSGKMRTGRGQLSDPFHRLSVSEVGVHRYLYGGVSWGSLMRI